MHNWGVLGVRTKVLLVRYVSRFPDIYSYLHPYTGLTRTLSITLLVSLLRDVSPSQMTLMPAIRISHSDSYKVGIFKALLSNVWSIQRLTKAFDGQVAGPRTNTSQTVLDHRVGKPILYSQS
ncbi:hypothetical protein BDR07DRAFT_1421167 [Suillus spraguei]|nr:hypothetical protein BDR07DRAFT_1421167 [Suillus spraguei]